MLETIAEDFLATKVMEMMLLVLLIINIENIDIFGEEKQGRFIKVIALRDSGGMVPENFLQVLALAGF